MNAVSSSLLAILCLCLAGVNGAETGDFFVSVVGSDRNSGKLAEPGDGDGPFATLKRARLAALELRKAQADRRKPIVIRLRGGAYYSAVGQAFSPDESGTAMSPLVIEAYPGEVPVLSAGRAISGWSVDRDGQWQAVLPEVKAGKWRFSQLYVNDQRRQRASLPAEGYYQVEAPVGGTGKWSSDRFRFRKGDMKADWRNLGDIEVVAFHKWSISRIPLRSVDEENRICELAGSTWNPEISPLNRSTWYRLENVRDAAREPGRWFLDRGTGTLSYSPMPGETPGGVKVVAPRDTRVLLVEGDRKAGAPVEHIVFRGITFAHDGWNVPGKGYSSFQAERAVPGAVTMHFARNIRFEGCVFRHTGNYGLQIGEGCRDIAVEGCEFFDTGAGGIRIGPDRFNGEPDQTKWSSRCTIRDNLVAHGGRVHPGAVGIWLAHAHDCRVEHNEIRDHYYSGMSIGWVWNYETSPATNNTIAHNLIRDIGHGVLSDMGGIYTLGVSPGTTIHHNRIHNVKRARYGGWGIYLDQGSANMLIENNLVTDTEDGGFHLHWGRDNIVRNNIFAHALRTQLKLSNPQKSGALALEGNVWLWNEGDFFGGKLDDEFRFARNLYWKEGGGEFSFPGDADADGWREREKGFVIADPGFKKLRDGDVSLPEGRVPQEKIGFQPFDLADCGRLTGENRTVGLPIPPQTFAPAGEPPPFRMEEDFEQQHADRNVSGWGQMAASKEENVKVIDGAGVGGGKALVFRDGPGGASYFPHLYRKVEYTGGRVLIAFDIKAEDGAHMRFDARDWDQPKYFNGPSLELKPDGTVAASGKALVKAPHNAWIRIEAVCPVGPDSKGSYAVSVTLPGAGEVKKFSGLKYEDGFETITWVGFCCNTKKPVAYSIDNLTMKLVEDRY